jgi:hypothetical protein
MEAGTTAPQPWARSPPVVALLDNILDGKTITDVDLELLLSEGGLHDEHVFQLVDLIPARIKKRKISVDYALYTMLYHLLGGADAELDALPVKANDSTLAFGVYARRYRQSYKEKLKTLKDESRRAPTHLQAAHAEGIEQQLELALTGHKR